MSTTAAHDLISSHRGIAYSVLRHLRIDRGRSFEDAEAEALLALTVAASTFDPSRGAAFSTWSWIKVCGHLKDWMSAMRRQGALPPAEALMPSAAPLPDELVQDAQVDALIVDVLADVSPEVADVARAALRGSPTDGMRPWRKLSRGSAERRMYEAKCKARIALTHVRDLLGQEP